MARDKGTPAKSSLGVVTIIVFRNYNGPVFLNENDITRTVYEDAPIGDTIFTTTARDSDRAGPQSELTFSLSGSQAAQSYFNLLDATSTQQGVYSTDLTIARPLYEDNSDTLTYTFTLNAQDNGDPVQRNSTSVTINVIRNLQPPVFSTAYYSVPISYLANVSDVIATVTATDADTDSKYNTSSLRYAIVQGGENTAQTQYFGIDSSTGAIRLRQSVASDSATSYVLTVTATDGGTPALVDYATVYFNINRNQNKPVITSPTLTVTILETENAKEIANITASDSDLQAPFNQLFFSMVTTDSTIQQYFGVFSNGVVFTRKSFLDLPSPDRFEIEVQVCDRAPAPDTLCADSNGRVIVNVIRNHYPYFVSLPYDRDLDLSFAPGQTVVDVEGVDPDPVDIIFGQLKYSLIGDDGNENSFNINEDTGIITVTNTNGVTGEAFQLRIRVCDLGGLCNVTVATITVRTNRFAPELNNTNYRRIIPETWALGETVISVGARDNDTAPPNNQYGFELQSGGGSNTYAGCFAINSESGVIYALRALYRDPCNQAQYNFEVVAKDRGRTSLTSVPSTVQIDITRNQNPPQFTQRQYTAFINETAPVGDIVIRISAIDLDTETPFNTLNYAILGDDQATVYFNFTQVDNNIIDITVRQSVLDSNQDQYFVQLFVVDGGTPAQRDTSVLIITVRRNLHAPFFNPTNYGFTIQQDQPIGVSIGQVSATDLDAPKLGSGDVTYSLTASTQPDDYFGVRSSDGVIVVNRDLTLDTSNALLYLFSVNVRDRGNPSQAGTNTATVTVTVQRNLNCPDLSNNLPTEITINETYTGLIFTAQARDNDITPYFSTPTYSLAGDGANSLFFIDNSTGQINVNSVIQNRNDPIYKLQVVASDGFCLNPAQATLTVNVRRNLFPPRWTGQGPSFQVTIRETQDILNSITQLTADDQDLTGVGSTVSYRFQTNSSHQNLFFISENGDVYLRRTMVGLADNTFVMNVSAEDDGGLTSQPGTLTVSVIRNDFTPEILNMPPNTARSVRSDTGLTVEIFTCTSRDSDTEADYGQVNYRIVGEGRASNMFKVNSSTCEVTLRTDLTSDTAQAYTVLIEAFDNAGAATRSSTGTLTINVDRNLYPPQFINQPYSFEILEIQELGIPFGYANASDNDTVSPYGDIYYEAMGNDTVLTYFGINADGGLISLRSQWQYPDRSENIFRFDVRLRDGAGQQSPVTASVIVTVIRNTQPVFTNTANYRVSNLTEDTAGGTVVFTPPVTNQDSRCALY
ncbi:protocadherin Fat 4-like [Littorina saxatilis]|uniref:protocadherin Fat 4-like n=1 Tax=Littorina saxatilis TaxID=31220 RepID=UPI0038B4A6AC